LSLAPRDPAGDGAAAGAGRGLAGGGPDRKKYLTSLWRIDPGGGPARRLTRSAEGEASPRFLPDGSLLFTSKRPDPAADSARRDGAGAEGGAGPAGRGAGGRRRRPERPGLARAARRRVPRPPRAVPDENHWILSPGNARIWYETVFAFLAEHVLGQEWQRPALL